MKDLFLTCSHILEDGEDVVIITIIDQEGSVPRTAGSKMLVCRDGTTVGTIGGGHLRSPSSPHGAGSFPKRTGDDGGIQVFRQ